MEITAPELWQQVLQTTRSAMPEQSFRTWLAGSEAVALTDTTLVVEVPSPFHAEWIEDKYGPSIHELLNRMLGRPIQVTYAPRSTGRVDIPLPDLEVEPEFPSPVPVTQGSHPGASPGPHVVAMNDRYTFDRFVVGPTTQLAAAACRAAAENPGRIYNPLFLYGGVGLGKTHLMHAIGNAILEREPRKRIAYVTSEEFTNDLVTSIQRGVMAAFRARYRQIDLLLVDDVHFLEGKERTQEEFFHTFNALHDARKQIILTSDRPPKDIPGLESRLISRFEWGLVADVKPPDFETRMAILRKKADDDQLVIDEEVIEYIARHCTASVRELEGAVIKLLAYSSLTNQEVTVTLAQTALQGVLSEDRGADGSTLTPKRIAKIVAREYDVEPKALASKRRTRTVTVPRQVAMFLIKDMLDTPLVDIGDFFGGRDHSTVIHSIRKVEEQLPQDPELAARVKAIRERLQEYL
jgi:chromosomal replication initiator protein